ncbi:MAG: hypothetical protein ACOCQ3_02165 [Natronomonas sp.]
MTKPEWWDENQAIRDRLDLPVYEPPRLSDGTYTHEVVPDLEEEHECTIRLLGVNTTYPEAWELRVDGETVREIERHRDARGNTVYGITTSALRNAIDSAVQ